MTDSSRLPGRSATGAAGVVACGELDAPSAWNAREDNDLATLQGDPETAEMFFVEALEHLGSIEASVLELEATPGNVTLLNAIFRPFHTVKGNAAMLGATTVQGLAHSVEGLLDLCRSGRHIFGPAEADATLEAVDVLSGLLTNLQRRMRGERRTDHDAKRRALVLVVEHLVEMDTVTSASADAATDDTTPVSESAAPVQVFVAIEADGRRALRTLIVDTDFTHRLVLQRFMSRYGECHIAVSGTEAVQACTMARASGTPYDVVCMDVLADAAGAKAVQQIRACEEEQGIRSTDGARIVVTTAVTDMQELIGSFQLLCDAYLVKPIDTGELLRHLREFRLIG